MASRAKVNVGFPVYGNIGKDSHKERNKEDEKRETSIKVGLFRVQKMEDRAFYYTVSVQSQILTSKSCSIRGNTRTLPPFYNNPY